MVYASPYNFICVIRTTAPSYFPRTKRKNIWSLQKKAIDYLRDKCYVVVYDPNQTFLNHAKFLIYYHICLSEKIIYRRKFYGSTNFTATGLAYIWDLKGKGKIGNYEEYVITNHGAKLRLNKYDIFYLNEIKELIEHRAKLYTDQNYLKKFLTKHLNRLRFILKYSRKIVSSTPLGLLFRTYLNLVILYSQTYALLDEIPGKKLTEEIENNLVEIQEPMDPFEIEVIVPISVEDKDVGLEEFEALARDLNLKDKELRESIVEYIKLIQNTYKIIRDKYVSNINTINYYYDSKEKEFLQFIEEYGYSHIKSIRKLIDLSG